MSEKDCAEEYFECVSECDINDTECEEVCVTDLKECDVPMIKAESDFIAELLVITGELGGNMQRLTTIDHSGRTSKKIVIEYDVKEKK